jgi:hypothetical protein
LTPIEFNRNFGGPLHQRRVAARTPHEQGVIAAQIAATDRQIDRLVYELYGLSEEDVRIVEGG